MVRRIELYSLREFVATFRSASGPWYVELRNLHSFLEVLCCKSLVAFCFESVRHSVSLLCVILETENVAIGQL